MTAITANETLCKQPYEKRQFSMDFDLLMDTDETINSSPGPQVDSEKINGDSSDLTISDVTISGHKVLFWIAGGTNNRRYRVEVQIITSGGQYLEGDGILVVKDK